MATSVGDATTPSNGSNAVNNTYDGLLAIWDAYNGTLNHAAGSDGPPPGWYDSRYWTSTVAPGGHASVTLYAGGIGYDSDPYYSMVALQIFKVL